MRWMWPIAAGLTMAAVAGVAELAQPRERTPEPNYTIIASERAFELREYSPMIVAQVEISGSRRGAMNRGFQRLAAYIFAQDRPASGQGEKEREKIAMTAPVLQQPPEKIAMTAPVMQATDGSDEWRIQFVMPASYTMKTLPQPPDDITLAQVPSRRIAAVQFNGYALEDELALMESELRGWLREEGLPAEGRAQYAFYDAPWVPARARRNEVLIEIDPATSVEARDTRRD